MAEVFIPAPGYPLSLQSLVLTLTHLKQLIKLFKIFENTQASVLKQIVNKLCRTVCTQEQG